MSTDSREPDQRGARPAHAPPSQFSKLSEQELAARTKRVERDLYWSRHEDRGKNHGDLEREWNDLKAEQARRNKQPWSYKHDRRNDFKIESTPSEGADGQQRTTTTVTGQVHDTDSTIRWRTDTQYGANRYKQIQRAAKRNGWIEDGHDLGHLAADEHGADPEGVNAGVVNSKTKVGSVTRPNYTSQGGRTNEQVGWRTEEARITEASRTAAVDYTITSVATDKLGLHREQHRTMEASQTVDGEVHSLSSDKVAHGGFDDRVKARERAEQAANRSVPASKEAEVAALKEKAQRHTTEKKAAPTPAVGSTPEKASSTEQLRQKSETHTQSKTKNIPKSKRPQ